MIDTFRGIQLWVMRTFNKLKDSKSRDKKIAKLKKGETLTPDDHVQKPLF